MITQDYSRRTIRSEELSDLRAIADVRISELTLDDYPNLLVFPDSFESYDRDFGRKQICNVVDEGKTLQTNSIVGFVGRNDTHLSIHSRFANEGEEDFFLHYMLQKVASINILNLHHTANEDDGVFDFLVYLFPSYLNKAVQQGVFKQYVRREHNDTQVRGAIDVTQHIRYNIPFNGKIAYTTREFSYDNDITELVRHTIEYISKTPSCTILQTDLQTQESVRLIKSVTPNFSSRNLTAVINNNLRPLAHPYYCEYTPLQRLCLQILRHEELKYGQETDEISGILIDAAWLWEEYLAVLLEGKYDHYLKDKGKRFNLFEDGQQIIPDYLSKDKSVVADAKYIPLNKKNNYGEEKATAIYYKTITYMYRFGSRQAFLFYPYPDEEVKQQKRIIKSETPGTPCGSITKLGLRIPCNCSSYREFCDRIQSYEQDFLKQL